jgi:adenylate kinase family enzyme
MTDYDLLVLSPIEFEDISKDLLEKRLKLELEIFGAGKDKGIDLRYARAKSNDLIVQCKRYKDFRSLKSTLKSKELPKIKRLKPKRYVLATTVSLSPAQKEELMAVLSPYVKKPADIFGRTEINSLIGRYPSVEKKHYKLWLASTAVLHNLLHSKVANQSELELKNITQNLKTYAENPSYADALEMLQQNHFVIISGLPGVGKTTLARVLVYRLLGDNQFEEFVFVSGSVDDAYEMFDEHKSQLFLFDDFLGTNFLEQKIGRNEDSRLLEFIRMVSRSNNTALILTTREYILRQAQGMFRQLDDNIVKSGKYVIDLSGYTKLVRARILYNHLFAADMPAKYLNEFLRQKVYKLIIDHKNYNPRLIEIVLRERPWEGVPAKAFPGVIIEYFDRPYRIWENIYDNEISEHARTVLEVLFTATVPIRLEDLVVATRSYLRHKGLDSSRNKIDKALRELDGTFITSTLQKDDGIVVGYENPSVYDFLYDYYSTTRQEDLIGVIESAVFLNQLTGIFAPQREPDQFVPGGKIAMKDTVKAAVASKIIRDFPTMAWSASRRIGIYYSGGARGFGEPTLAEKANMVLFGLGLVLDPAIDAAMLKQYKAHLADASADVPFFLDDSLELLEHYHQYLSEEEVDAAVYDVAAAVRTFSDIEEVDSAELYYPFAQERLLESEYFRESAEDALVSDANEIDADGLSGFLDDVSDIASRYGISLARVEQLLDEREREAHAEAEAEFYAEGIRAYTGLPSGPRPSRASPARPYSPPPTEEEIIDKMFGSLD